MSVITAPLGWSLCFCTDGQHAAKDSETPRLDRDAVERDRLYVPPTERHLIRVSEVREAIPFTDDDAELRAREIAGWAEATNRLPVDVERPCGHRDEDACEACVPELARPSLRAVAS